MAAAFSTSLGDLGPTRQLFVGMHARRGSTTSSCSYLIPSSSSSSSSPRRKKMIEANIMKTATPTRALIRRNQLAKVTVDYKKSSMTAERLDRWIRDSIGEIVRNIGGGGGEAPFLVQIFSTGATSFLRLDMERGESFLSESWKLIKKTWEQGSSSCCDIPDGLVLVKKLRDEGYSRTWGLVVQGRGMDCDAASCYTLDTCRVETAAGFCTHFALVRVQCTGDSLDMQLRRAWLQGR